MSTCEMDAFDGSHEPSMKLKGSDDASLLLSIM